VISTAVPECDEASKPPSCGTERRTQDHYTEQEWPFLKVAEEDTSSDVTRKGRHMSAVEETGQKGDAQSKATLTKSDGKTVLKPKSDRVKDPAKTEAEKSQEKPAPKKDPKQDLKQESKQAHSQPAPTLASKLELIR